LDKRVRWFTHELGALADYSLKPQAYFVRTKVKQFPSSYGQAKREEFAHIYGVFTDYRQWWDFVQDVHVCVAVIRGPLFELGTLEYDRRRCALLRARGSVCVRSATA
jgi:hypothetical protein